MIIRAFPFPLHFNAVLGRALREPVVRQRQRAFADLAVRRHADGVLLIGGRMRYMIGVAAGEIIDASFRRVHRHVHLVALDPLRHQRPHAQLAITRDELDLGAALEPALLRQLGRDLHKGVGDEFFDALRAVCHDAFVEMLQQPPIVEMQIVGGIDRVLRQPQLDGMQPRLLVGKFLEALGVEQRLVGSVLGHRPLQ